MQNHIDEISNGVSQSASGKVSNKPGTRKSSKFASRAERPSFLQMPKRKSMTDVPFGKSKKMLGGYTSYSQGKTTNNARNLSAIYKGQKSDFEYAKAQTTAVMPRGVNHSV